jgi:hypothetical protein
MLGIGARTAVFSLVNGVLAFAAVVAAAPLVVAAGRPPARQATPQEPELYGAGVFSTGAWDFFLAFSADERHALFCRANDDFSAYDIFETTMIGGHWRAPTRASFASQWSNADPHLSADGRTLYFVSNRPGPGETAPHATYDIWITERTPDDAWGSPRRLPAPVSEPDVDEFSPSVATNGNLYFGSECSGGHGGFDLWVARKVEGGYAPPENLGDSINTAGGEVEPWIAPDESYLIFSAKGRADSTGRYDLYLSRRVRGEWTRAQPLGHGVNTTWQDFNQSVSPDGRWLYFSSTRPLRGPLGTRFDWPRRAANVDGIGNGKGDMYRIPLGVFGLGPA